MKKIGSVLLNVFSVGIILCLLAGGGSLLGYIVALCIGGENATQICIFIHKQYFPILIQITSIFAGIGLLGMYFTKIRALSVKPQTDENEK